MRFSFVTQLLLKRILTIIIMPFSNVFLQIRIISVMDRKNILTTDISTAYQIVPLNRSFLNVVAISLQSILSCVQK